MNTTQNCTRGKYLDLESGCPIQNYCNMTEITARGVILLEDLSRTNQTSNMSLNATNDGNLSLHLTANQPCFIALANMDQRNLTLNLTSKDPNITLLS